MKKISTKQKIVLIISGLFLCAVLLEIGLRIGGFVFLSLQEHRNRIAIQKKGTYRIMCLGESTTALGGKYSYSSQLEEILNQPEIGIKFSVINKGVPATDTTAIVAQLEDNLNRYHPDMVTIMVGINDGLGKQPYKGISDEKNIRFISSFRTYGLTKFLWLHIKNKFREIGVYKIKEKKEHITFVTKDLKQQNKIKTQKNTKTGAIEIDFEVNKEYYDLGEFNRKQGKFDKAIEMFKKAIERNPKNVHAYIGLGRSYWELRNFDKTEEMAKKAIEINPRSYNAYSQLGYCYKQRAEYDKFEEILKKLIEINPISYMAYIELGLFYKSQGKYPQAEESFKKAIELNPQDDVSYMKLSNCYNELGKHRLAEIYFRKANRLRLEYYNPITRHNYQRIKEIVTERGIKLICVQYPMRSVEPLKRMFDNQEGIIFVDNEGVFREAIERAGYNEYFTDMFGGDFGHCTTKGNRLLAENIANIILKECINK